MRMALWSLAAVLGVSIAWAGPERGVLRFEARDKVPVPGFPEAQLTLGPYKFKGGQRATVLAKGDRNPPVDLGLQVFDSNKRLVAEDKGKGDFAAVIWYPPRDEEYSIVILNPQQILNEVYLVIK